jgi:hypothetical protein
MIAAATNGNKRKSSATRIIAVSALRLPLADRQKRTAINTATAPIRRFETIGARSDNIGWPSATPVTSVGVRRRYEAIVIRL